MLTDETFNDEYTNHIMMNPDLYELNDKEESFFGSEFKDSFGFKNPKKKDK